MPVERFLKSLQKTYSQADFNAVLEHYSLPLAVVKDEYTITIENDWQLRAHIRLMLKDQAAAGIREFDTSLIAEYAVGDALTLVRYSLTAVYNDGSTELPTYAAFVLREIQGSLRITATIATRSRWRARAGIAEIAAPPPTL